MIDKPVTTLRPTQSSFRAAKVLFRLANSSPINQTSSTPDITISDTPIVVRQTIQSDKIFKKQLRASCVPGAPSGAPPTVPVTGSVAKPRRKRRPNPQSIRLSDKAQKELKVKAKMEGISVHQMARALLEAALFCEQSISVLPRARIESCENALHLWLVEHSRQGNNLNQLAVNSNKALLKGEAQPMVVNELRNIREVQKGILHALVRIQTWVNTVNRPVTIVDNGQSPR